MPRLREDPQPDAVVDVRQRSQQRAPTDEVVLVDDGPAELPPAPVFAHEPLLLDAPGTARKRRRVAELEEIAAANARAAVEARAVALEQRRHLEAATDAWRATASDLADLRRDLKGFAAARADLIAKERARAEQTARTDVEAQLHRLESGHAELQSEIDRLRVALAEQQGLNGDSTQRLRDEQRKRAEAEREAERAIAAYETAERRLETARDALHRHAVDEHDRIEAADAARLAAEAELEALGGGGQVAKLTDRVEDLVLQLGELDAELVAMESRAEAAEAAAAGAAREAADAGGATDRARADAAEARHALDEIVRDRDALQAMVADLERVGAQSEARRAEVQARADAAEAAAADVEGALASARSEAAAATDRARVARVRLEEIVQERDALLATVATLEHDVPERERRAAEAAAAGAAQEIADAGDTADQAQADAEEARHALDEVVCDRDALRAKVAELEQAGAQWEARATEAQERANAAEAAVTDVDGTLASARDEADAATDRATVARVRLEEIAHERDALLATVATLEHDVQERERRAADDAARAEAARALADTAGLEEALVAARFEAETLRGETSALAAQLEEARSLVEAARRAEPTEATDPADAAVDAESTDAEGSLLDAFAELAATPDLDDDGSVDDERDRPVERVRLAPPAPDPDDPDARRAALGFLNALARDLPASRPNGH